MSLCPKPPSSLHSGAPPPHGPVQTCCSSGSGQGAHPSHRLTPTAADSEELPPIPVTTQTHTQKHAPGQTDACLFFWNPASSEKTEKLKTAAHLLRMWPTTASRWRRPQCKGVFVFTTGGVFPSFVCFILLLLTAVFPGSIIF